METKYTIKQDRNACIGCGACAAACPEFWSMAKDGKSKLKGAQKKENNETLGTKEKPLTKSFDSNKEAAESCPVNCIHIFEITNGKEKKII